MLQRSLSVFKFLLRHLWVKGCTDGHSSGCCWHRQSMEKLHRKINKFHRPHGQHRQIRGYSQGWGCSAVIAVVVIPGSTPWGAHMAGRTRLLPAGPGCDAISCFNSSLFPSITSVSVGSWEGRNIHEDVWVLLSESHYHLSVLEELLLSHRAWIRGFWETLSWVWTEGHCHNLGHLISRIYPHYSCHAAPLAFYMDK